MTTTAFLGPLCTAFIFTGLFSTAAAQGDSGPTAPGALNRIVVNVAPQQVVGHPFQLPAQLLLLDENSQLIIDYDLAANPIALAVSEGQLTPSLVSDPALFYGGIVDLSPLGLTYHGPSSSVTLTASSSGVVSAGVRVSFSGYDILAARDLLGRPITSVYADLPTDIKVAVTNGGDLAASGEPSLKAYFASGGGSVKVFFAGGSAGRVDTLTIALPTQGLDPGDDTLVLVLDAQYRPADMLLAVADSLLVPLVVGQPASVEFVAGSVRPDSVYVGEVFDLAFDVAVSGFPGVVDTADLEVYLVSVDSTLLARIYYGSPDSPQRLGDTLRFSAPQALVPSAAGLTTGWYSLRLRLRMYSGGNLFALDGIGVDSLFLVPPAALSFDEATLDPMRVAAGQETRFEFDVLLDAPAGVIVDDSLSLFRVFGEGFSGAANLLPQRGDLEPGRNRITTGPIFVPNNQLGVALTVSATIVYAQSGAANRLSAVTDFGGLTIDVQELPVVQIVEVRIVAPNAPRVNTDQPFTVIASIANTSATAVPEFELQMVSDGQSLFTPTAPVAGVPPHDTIEVAFNVVAAAAASPSELFRVDVATIGVPQLPPLDNTAIATIQRPADLVLSLIWRGAESGVVATGDDFDLLINIVNLGDAEAGLARFRVNTNGVYLGLPDSALILEEALAVGALRGISFMAPSFDTTVTISFAVIEHPIDFNTGLPAPFSDGAADFTIAITSLDIALEVEAVPVASNVVWAGGEKELFELRLTNSGVSSVTDVRVEGVRLRIYDRNDDPVNARDVMEIGNTGLYHEGRLVSHATAGQDLVHLSIDDFEVEASQSETLSFRTKVKAESGIEFGVRFSAADVEASFAHGPLAGQPVAVEPAGGDSLVLATIFSTRSPGPENSFVIRNNPFDPALGPAEFSYFLEEDEDVAFRVFTLVGELVYEKDYAAGDHGGARGENVIAWDGRNGDGDLVLNGVYLALIETARSDQQATIKVAVVR